MPKSAPTVDVLIAEFRAFVRAAKPQDGSYIFAFLKAKNYPESLAKVIQNILDGK